MDLSSLYLILLCTSLTFLIAQLFVVKKQVAHIIFAVFCGSIAIMATKKLTGDSIGAYQYLLGMGVCATCNGYWLLSRSLFRNESPIQIHHVLFAAAIALLIVIKQGYLFASSLSLLSALTGNLTQHVLTELTVLLSSCVLVLSFWEGCRGFKQASKTGKAQRVLFLTTFGLAVSMSKVSQGVLANNPQAHEWVIAFITLFVLFNTHVLMRWRFKESKAASSVDLSLSVESITVDKSPMVSTDERISYDESELAHQVKELLVGKSLFLQPNLKVADIARQLDVSEYRISRALRNEQGARNFNQYINELRIKHAQDLLVDPDKQKWPVLVVGLESGFASVGPFTRAFKAMTSFTPNQYRQRMLGEGG